MDKYSSPIDPSDSPQENLGSTSPSGTITDPSLGALRDQIKKVLIPTLIKIFQLKLELNQALSPPSRLYPSKPLIDPEPILQQLTNLDEDLNTLSRWCESCRSQIQKAIHPHEEHLKNKITPHAADSPADLLARKSFSSAVSSHSHEIKRSENSHFWKSHYFFSSSLKRSQKKWWKALRGFWKTRF